MPASRAILAIDSSAYEWVANSVRPAPGADGAARRPEGGCTRGRAIPRRIPCKGGVSAG